MEIKHKYLEQIRVAPKEALQITGISTRMGKTIVRGWDLSLTDYHEKGLDAGVDYIQNYCSDFKDNQRNRDKTENLIQNLVAYDEDFTNLGHECYQLRIRIKIDITHSNYVTGEILRVDKTMDNGYAITLMQRESSIWANELRFPLIQRYFSNKYVCPYDLVKVGVYDFETMKHKYISYDEETLNDAWNEITDLSNEINKFII